MAERASTAAVTRASDRSGSKIRVERHVLASPADSFDTAWSTYGWSPGIEGRTGALEEEVPWGSHRAREDEPAKLSGRAESIVAPSNLDRLGSSVLSLDGRIGFSLWGAVGEGPARNGWRVVTHTLLFDEEGFRRIAGHPEGLLGTEASPAPWLRALTESERFDEPAPLEPLVLSGTESLTQSLERSRLATIRRFRQRLLEAGRTVESLGLELAGAYEALAASMRGEGVEHVVVRGSGALTSCLLRLVWLSLPLEDRVRAAYVTEQRKTERPRGHLLGLPGAEWGRYVPDGSFVVGEDDDRTPGPGRIRWGALVADPDAEAAFTRLDSRALVRGWRLVSGDDLRVEGEHDSWRSAWRVEGPGVEAAIGLVEREVVRTDGPRFGAAGCALGSALARRPSEDSIERVLRTAWMLGGNRAASLLRGVVRTLRMGGADGPRVGAVVRCRAAARGDGELGRELHRLVDRESDALRALLGAPEGGNELVEAAAPLAARGDKVGRELLRLGAAEADWTASWTEELAVHLAELADAREGGPGWSGVADVMALILETLRAEQRDPEVVGTTVESLFSVLKPLALPAVAGALVEMLQAGREPMRPQGNADPNAAFAEVLVRRLVTVAGGAGLPEESVDGVLRLLWVAGSTRALCELADRPSVMVAVLAQLLVAPAPVPLFHRLRRDLVRTIETGGPAQGLEPWMDRLGVYAPGVIDLVRKDPGGPGAEARIFLRVER